MPLTAVLHRLALFAALLSGVEASAQQFTYTQDLGFQTITPTPARAGVFDLHPYDPTHFAAHARDLLNPADYAVYDSLGQPTGQHFLFHPALPNATPSHFVADAAGNAYIAGTYRDTILLPFTQSRIVVAKFLQNGSPDSTWGLHGIWYGDTATAGWNPVHGLQVLASGAVMLVDVPIVAGASSPYFFLSRLTPAGQLDTAFGVQGSTLMNPDNRSTAAFYFAADGSTYAARNAGNTVHAWLTRWRSDGSHDTTLAIPGSTSRILNLLPDGRIISIGHIVGGGWGLRRHWANGLADTTYSAPAIYGYGSPLPGGGHLSMAQDYNGTPFPTLAKFSVLLPDGTRDPTYMPAGHPLLFSIPASFWPAPGCHPDAYPSFGSILALGARRIIYSDYLYAQVSIGGSHHDYEYFYCPRIVSLVTDLQTVGTPAPVAASNLALWPNPVADHFSLRIPTRARSAQVQLYDLAGKALALPTATVTTVEGGLQYAYQDLGGLPSGLYLLRVAAGGQQFTAKLLKE